MAEMVVRAQAVRVLVVRGTITVATIITAITIIITAALMQQEHRLRTTFIILILVGVQAVLVHFRKVQVAVEEEGEEVGVRLWVALP